MEVRSEPSSFHTQRFERFSTWGSLLRAIGFLVHIARSSTSTNNAKECRGWHQCKQPCIPDELSQAMDVIITAVQKEAFPEEFSVLTDDKLLPKSSPPFKLSPVLQKGLMRIGGGLKHAPLEHAEKNPLVLPKRSQAADFDAPLEADVDASLEADVDAPLEADVDAPLEADVDAPLEADVDAPLEVDVDAPLEVDINAPLEVDVDAPLEVDVDAPLEADVEAPLKRERPPLLIQRLAESPNLLRDEACRRGKITYFYSRAGPNSWSGSHCPLLRAGPNTWSGFHRPLLRAGPKYLEWILLPSAQSWPKFLEWIPLPSAQSWPKYLEWIPLPFAQSWPKYLEWIPLPSTTKN
ncbi:hypothetical protein JOQ06_004985 [Pogonophryne albipinna]|uniref:Uncharacterized protein n=1 Tax=Pogonophryne albipinna TaxID=1090488 RepID=A0AAD6AR35_9TELE|nr:hypothetical protein JOQ06_004985 [Pogonophryne albipinna]